jgi:hypothetical protein
VLDFIDPQRTIPGLVPEIMKVEVCYSVDDLGVNLDEVEVIARDAKSRIWAYALDPSAPAASVIALPPRAPDLLPPTVLPRQINPDEKSDDKR